MISLRWGFSTDVGMVRETNQDGFLVAEPLFAVADGMGGHQGGEVASATALEILQETFAEPTREALLEAVRRANAKVWDKAQLDEHLRNMGTTLTAMAKIRDEETGEESLAVVNVGDSRTYLFRDGELGQVTTDHSLVEEMVRAGEISAKEAETHPRRNILTRALGVEPTVEVDIDMVVPRPGDRFLLCSDGLVREVGDDQISSILRRLKSPDEAVKELVSQAKNHGGHDNITVVLVDVEDDSRRNVTSVPPSQSKPRDSVASAPRTTPQPGPRPRRFTFRVLLFILAVLALVAVGAGSVVWYARSSVYVGLEGEQLVIYRGRPDPVLWFEPTVLQRTNVSTAQVLPGEVPALQTGSVFASVDEAERYILNLTTQAAAAQQAAAPSNSPPATDAPAAPPPP